MATLLTSKQCMEQFPEVWKIFFAEQELADTGSIDVFVYDEHKCNGRNRAPGKLLGKYQVNGYAMVSSGYDSLAGRSKNHKVIGEVFNMPTTTYNKFKQNMYGYRPEVTLATGDDKRYVIIFTLTDRLILNAYARKKGLIEEYQCQGKRSQY